MEVSPVPWDGRAVEEAEKLTRALGNSFGRQFKDPVDQAAACLRRLARLARAALQPFASAEDSEFLCEVCSYDLVGVLPGGPTAQPASAALAKELQEKVRTRAGQLYDDSAKELSSFLSAVVQGRGGKLDIVGSGHKYANRVEKLALLLGKQPACEDVKKVLSVATRAADIVSKGATGALVPQDVALLTAAAEDMAKVHEGAMHAVIQWFEDRGGAVDFNKEALEALMAKAQHAAASFQKAKKAENAKAVDELSAVKDARAALETCQALLHSSSMCLRTESDSMPLRLQLDLNPIRFRFDSDSTRSREAPAKRENEDAFLAAMKATRGDQWKGDGGLVSRTLFWGLRSRLRLAHPLAGPHGQAEEGNFLGEVGDLVREARGGEGEARGGRGGPGRGGCGRLARCRARVAVCVRVHQQHPLAALGEGP